MGNCPCRRFFLLAPLPCSPPLPSPPPCMKWDYPPKYKNKMIYYFISLQLCYHASSKTEWL